jgi:acyl-coenzyme A synthetase/AMP-(fatty) acid ligase
VLQEHPAVLGAGAVGIPEPELTHKSRAYIVVRPGYHVTADELIQYVAARLPHHMQIHGGVR